MPSINASHGAIPPPHHEEFERLVLCSCIIDPNGIRKVYRILKRGDFYDHRNGVIFQAIVKLYEANEKIDVSTVAEKLERNGKLELVGGDVYLAQLSGELATSAHVEHYAKQLKDYSILRKVLGLTDQTRKDVFLLPPAGDILNRTLDGIITIKQEWDAAISKEPKDPIGDATKEAELRMKGQGDAGVMTYIESLDDVIGGFFPEDLVVIAGRPSIGKSDLSLNIARNNAANGNPVLFISIEMPVNDIIWRVMSLETGIFRGKIRGGKISEFELGLIKECEAKIKEYPLYIKSPSSYRIGDVRSLTQEYLAKHSIKLVIIDYLQLIDPEKAGSREQEVAGISRALKGLGRECHIPVIALSQLSRAVESRDGNKMPELHDLRDSGAIEQDADTVMFINRKDYRKKPDPNEPPPPPTMDISIAKGRNVGTGLVNEISYERGSGIIGRSVPNPLPTGYAWGETRVDIGDSNWSNEPPPPSESLPF